jgi:phage terminase large subunit GpA-like protein
MVRVTPKRRATPLPAWIEANLRLPAGIAAEPGPIKLHPYQRAIADAIADPKIERVSVIKSARIGFTTLLVGAMRNHLHQSWLL